MEGGHLDRLASGFVTYIVVKDEKLFEHKAARNAGRMPALSNYTNQLPLIISFFFC